MILWDCKIVWLHLVSKADKTPGTPLLEFRKKQRTTTAHLAHASFSVRVNAFGPGQLPRTRTVVCLCGMPTLQRPWIRRRAQKGLPHPTSPRWRTLHHCQPGSRHAACTCVHTHTHTHTHTCWGIRQTIEIAFGGHSQSGTPSPWQPAVMNVDGSRPIDDRLCSIPIGLYSVFSHKSSTIINY